MAVVRDLRRHEGLYVAFDSRDIKRANVVAHGDRLHRVIDEARRKGVRDPLLAFVPHPHTVCAY